MILYKIQERSQHLDVNNAQSWQNIVDIPTNILESVFETLNVLNAERVNSYLRFKLTGTGYCSIYSYFYNRFHRRETFPEAIHTSVASIVAGYRLREQFCSM